MSFAITDSVITRIGSIDVGPISALVLNIVYYGIFLTVTFDFNVISAICNLPCHLHAHTTDIQCGKYEHSLPKDVRSLRYMPYRQNLSTSEFDFRIQDHCLDPGILTFMSVINS